MADDLAACPTCGQRSPAAEIARLQQELRELHRAHPTLEMAEGAWNMTAQLHIAVRGATWARPESTQQVWEGLLAEVMAMRESAATILKRQADAVGPVRGGFAAEGYSPDHGPDEPAAAPPGRASASDARSHSGDAPMTADEFEARYAAQSGVVVSDNEMTDEQPERLYFGDDEEG